MTKTPKEKELTARFVGFKKRRGWGRGGSIVPSELVVGGRRKGEPVTGIPKGGGRG